MVKKMAFLMTASACLWTVRADTIVKHQQLRFQNTQQLRVSNAEHSSRLALGCGVRRIEPGLPHGQPSEWPILAT